MVSLVLFVAFVAGRRKRRERRKRRKRGRRRGRHGRHHHHCDHHHPCHAGGTRLASIAHSLARSLLVRLKQGLTAYNHNLDTSPEYYEKVTTTRKYEDRLDTIESVRQAGISVCAGGIIGLGEGHMDRYVATG